MKRAVAVCLMLASLSFPQDKKRKPPKPPDVLILQIAARRDNGIISIDGRLRNPSEKPIQGMILLIDFFSSDKVLLTTKKGPVESELVESNGESDFRLEVSDQGRAITIRVNAEDANGRDLRVEKGGPYVIE